MIFHFSIGFLGPILVNISSFYLPAVNILMNFGVIILALIFVLGLKGNERTKYVRMGVFWYLMLLIGGLLLVGACAFMFFHK